MAVKPKDPPPAECLHIYRFGGFNVDGTRWFYCVKCLKETVKEGIK